jgi:hypothetical protein
MELEGALREVVDFLSNAIHLSRSDARYQRLLVKLRKTLKP